MNLKQELKNKGIVHKNGKVDVLRFSKLADRSYAQCWHWVEGTHTPRKSSLEYILRVLQEIDKKKS